ncbi:unnamed protein product [Protopolystoma xenopodis]|uniref:Uncharacterized protein n=1 Tax=Protopolystoma xenopodis TaxID=117903 RepID=A0A3S4ZTX9_9PLAT|nr:unnamed protein product [Protopolystoma xenopodis]
MQLGNQIQASASLPSLNAIAPITPAAASTSHPETSFAGENTDRSSDRAHLQPSHQKSRHTTAFGVASLGQAPGSPSETNLRTNLSLTSEKRSASVVRRMMVGDLMLAVVTEAAAGIDQNYQIMAPAIVSPPQHRHRPGGRFALPIKPTAGYSVCSY